MAHNAHPHAHRLTDPDAIKAYVMAGKAEVTLFSVPSNTRVTYTIRVKMKDRKPVKDGPWFVSVLVGPDNNRDYTFLGTIFANGKFKHSEKSKIRETAPSAKGIDFLMNTCLERKDVPDALEVWTSGVCGACGRKLTVPESIERGLGPECASRQ